MKSKLQEEKTKINLLSRGGCHGIKKIRQIELLLSIATGTLKRK
jgi:hypothetical protein